jgi:hypothetical protein
MVVAGMCLMAHGILISSVLVSAAHTHRMEPSASSPFSLRNRPNGANWSAGVPNASVDAVIDGGTA